MLGLVIGLLAAIVRDRAERKPPFGFFGIAREIGNNFAASFPLKTVHQLALHVIREHRAIVSLA